MLQTEQNIRYYARNRVTENNSALPRSLETENDEEINQKKENQIDYNVQKHFQSFANKIRNISIFLISFKFYFAMYKKKIIKLQVNGLNNKKYN